MQDYIMHATEIGMLGPAFGVCADEISKLAKVFQSPPVIGRTSTADRCLNFIFKVSMF